MIARLLRLLWPHRPHHQLETWLPGIIASREHAERETARTQEIRKAIRAQRLNPIADTIWPPPRRNGGHER